VPRISDDARALLRAFSRAELRAGFKVAVDQTADAFCYALDVQERAALARVLYEKAAKAGRADCQKLLNQAEQLKAAAAFTAVFAREMRSGVAPYEEALAWLDLCGAAG
jgi:TorA maturation chaperone TorD